MDAEDKEAAKIPCPLVESCGARSARVAALIRGYAGYVMQKIVEVRKE